MYKSNSKEVKALVRKEILTSLEGHADGNNDIERLQSYRKQLEINKKGILSYRKYGYCSMFEVVKSTLQGCYAGFEFTTEGIENFINSLQLNNAKGKKYSSEEYADLYYKLITRETEYLFKQLDKELEKNRIVTYKKCDRDELVEKLLETYEKITYDHQRINCYAKNGRIMKTLFEENYAKSLER